MRNPSGESFLYGSDRDNDHGSRLATRATKKIDAGEFEDKITGQGYEIDVILLKNPPFILREASRRTEDQLRSLEIFRSC
jgi:hypothetical protein